MWQLQFQHVPLYLEWAPGGVFVAAKQEQESGNVPMLNSQL